MLSGTACTKEYYDAGWCKDAKVKWKIRYKCTDDDYKTWNYGCQRNIKTTYDKEFQCKDFSAGNIYGCTYGIIEKDIKTTKSVTRKYCIDTTTKTDKEETDIRESKVENTKDTDTLTYSWNYVISTAKLFDKVISNKFSFIPYYQYSLENYNKFINRTGSYKDMTVEEFRESEQTNSQADSLQFEEADYNDENTETAIDKTWNSEYYVDTIPNGWIIKPNTSTSQVIKEVVTTKKVGKEYTDTYSWADRLKVEETVSGVYNLDSVKDVTGDDLTYDDNEYYNYLAANKELNIIDLMNSDNAIYENYVAKANRSTSTTNIGIRKAKLDISYNVLKKDLKELSEKNFLMYGNSLNILEGLNLGAIVAAGGVNDALIAVAESHMGNTLDDMMAINTYGAFYARSHWCAMFVSYCMRAVEAQTGVDIPIPSYGGCTSFWKEYHLKPGFYDVEEWVVRHQNTSSCSNKLPENAANIAPLSSIQPGDIILFCWEDDGPDEENWRHHTAIVKSIEKDAAGNVVAVTTIDGNTGGSGTNSFNNSRVDERTKRGHSLNYIASFVSVSTVLAEAERGNVW